MIRSDKVVDNVVDNVGVVVWAAVVVGFGVMVSVVGVVRVVSAFLWSCGQGGLSWLGG